MIGKLVCGCACCVLLLSAAQAHAATVVTDAVVSQAQQTQTDVTVTFGQVFKDGDVPRGTTVTASLDSRPVDLQVDAKATNPDGSLRHAVLTIRIPGLRGHAEMPLALATSIATTAATAISLPQLLATQYDAKVSLVMDNATYSADARTLLQAASAAGTCKRWGTQCNIWLSGPLASEWVVNGPVKAVNGTINPNLRVYFAVRAYAGSTPGTIGRVRTDIIVENSNAFAPQAQPQYTATLTSGSANYASPALIQYAYTRWHKVLWWNDLEPKVYARQDTQYIQASKAVSHYMQLKPGERFLDKLRQACAPLHHCDQTKTMENTGAQAAIGPLPRWTSVYIIDPDVRAYNWMLANTDALGAYSIHYRDQVTGWPVSVQRHPYATIANWAGAHRIARKKSRKGEKYKADLFGRCAKRPVTGQCARNPNKWDNAHQPAESYVPYMVTGDWYYMSELAFGASHNEIWSNETYRGFSKGLIDRAHTQIRGKAWVLREMANAAWLLPDSYPLKAEFNADVDNSLAEWNRKYTNNPSTNPLHLMNDGPDYDLHGGKHNGIAPWQHNFLTWSASHAAELGFAGAADFRNWLAKFEIGLMTDWQVHPQGYCWLEASAYAIRVKDSSGNWLPSYTAVYAATFPKLSRLECNSPPMVRAMGKSRKESWWKGKMYGYPSSPTGYPANLQIGLASAAESGLPNAKAAWAIFQSRSVKPKPPHGYAKYPNFAILPRSTL